MTIFKAYISATGKPNAYVLTHDVKKCLAGANAPKGWVHLVSLASTTAVTLLENDPAIYQPLIEKNFQNFSELLQNEKPKSLRRSGLGAAAYHCMAATFGYSLLLPFENGKLLTSVHQDVMVLDYEPKPGRREFILSVLKDHQPEGQR